jgi:hypothetical protein
MRLFFVVFGFLAQLTAFPQQLLQSPEAFLGYSLGARYTPHYQIVQYFQSVAAARPGSVKLVQYGKTYEGRPLILAFISSEENIRNLESIRMNNLRLAGLAKDKMAASEATPALVWLSYNVHGNEPSSSEAAMKTIHALLDPASAQAVNWLKNTVVVIDPCINPDGRDRYANWQNGVSSLVSDPNPQSREHREPWPGGRINHYYFDLNRDWAWQTQTESRQRVKVYNEWLPQVHVDFHEQSYNEPYYFAPAAEPYHEVITAWQREFQQLIGKNNAKYFDQKGWLYFTKERFDLFYPSYGDTYPTYNGAIGMTFEQGGGPRGGKAVQIDDGDTLTLADRIEHHYTTGLSTIEVSSVNATKLVREFRKFFSDGINGTSLEYKYYVVRTKSYMGSEGGTLGTYLRNNGLEYGFSTTKVNTKGFNYTTGKEESFTINENDLVIPEQQARAAMVKVLFEPNSKLSDSATYDITAWALPYAMGLEAYAVKEKIALGGMKDKISLTSGLAVTDRAPTAYAYVIPWTSIGSATLLSQLLKAGIKMRYAEQPFEISGRKFEKGSLIITKAANKLSAEKLFSTLTQCITQSPGYHESIFPVTSGFVDKGFDLGSGKVRYINAPKVALLAGEGVNPNAMGEIWHFFEEQLMYPVSVFNATDLGQINWKSFDVLIMPDGNYRFLGDKAITEAMRNWIQQGGRVIAIENAVSQLANVEWAIKRKKEESSKEADKTDYSVLKKYEDREKDNLRNSIPGAVYKVELDNTHPLAFGYPSQYFTLKQDDNLYEFIGDGGWNVGVIKKSGYVTGFAGVKTKEKLKDGLILGTQEMGRGSIIYFTDDPIFRGFWENGKLLLANAVFMVGQ